MIEAGEPEVDGLVETAFRLGFVPAKVHIAT